MLRLPCKVGDTIYQIPSKVNYKLNVLSGHYDDNRVYKQVVHSIEMYSNDRYLIATCNGICNVLSDSFKETWFLTRKEAEQKLKEMESD